MAPGCTARVVKLVDTRDLKSLGAIRAGSTPAPGTTDASRQFPNNPETRPHPRRPRWPRGRTQDPGSPRGDGDRQESHGDHPPNYRVGRRQGVCREQRPARIARPSARRYRDAVLAARSSEPMRSDLLAKRRNLMDAWAQFVTGTPADVLNFDDRVRQGTACAIRPANAGSPSGRHQRFRLGSRRITRRAAANRRFIRGPRFRQLPSHPDGPGPGYPRPDSTDFRAFRHIAADS